MTKRFCHLHRAPISRGGLFRYRNSIGLHNFYLVGDKESLNVVTCDIGQLDSWGDAFSDLPFLGDRTEDSQAFGFGDLFATSLQRSSRAGAGCSAKIQALSLLKYYCYERWNVGLRELSELCTV